MYIFWLIDMVGVISCFALMDNSGLVVKEYARIADVPTFSNWPALDLRDKVLLIRWLGRSPGAEQLGRRQGCNPKTRFGVTPLPEKVVNRQVACGFSGKSSRGSILHY